MKLYDTFSKKSPNKVFFSILLGACAGIAYAFLIPIVVSSLGQDHSPQGRFGPDHVERLWTFEISNIKLASVFFFLCLFILVARSTSQITLLRASMDIATDLRMSIYQRVAHTPIAFLERMGSSKIVAVLTADVNRIVSGARMLPDLLISVVTLLGMLAFLLYMNSSVFWFVMGAITFGVISYQIPIYFGNRDFARSRAAADDLQQSIGGLIHGAKELKLNQGKRDSYFNEVLSRIEADIRKYDKRGYTIVRAAMNYGDLISFFVIGAVTFVFVNYHSITNAELLGVIMALLYVTGPVATILNCIPTVVIAHVSLKKVTNMLDLLPEEEGAHGIVRPLDWESISFSNVCFRHESAEGTGFQVGPINLEIERGQVTFIVGGNGSGKSTLSKLLTLHYTPTAGQIRFGSTVVDAGSLVSCRHQIAAIFSDYYLFDRLLGVADEAAREQTDNYLRALRLDHKVSLKNGRFSTLALSDGQRKRLALLVAFLDDKSLYLFDEWAADQDSTFKEVFYHQILPDLKKRGKAVIVISHDDSYFGVADKVIVMNEGRLARVECPARVSNRPEAASACTAA